ncbi:MAG: hypothetical protein ACUVQ3_08615, partial [bacterium]
IYSNIKDKKIKIHIGDWKGSKQDCDEYYKIIEEINRSKDFSCTVNSLKKNIFPDLAVMEFLDRFDKNNTLLLGNKRSEIYYVKLSDSAIGFVNEKSLLKKYKIYINAVEKLVEPILEELFIILYKEFDSVNIYEYTFILSDPNLGTNEKVNLTKEYRKLKKVQQASILSYVQRTFDKINKKAKSKTEKRDFMNWYNESLQVFNLLNQTIYFKTFRKTVLMLSISQEVLEFVATRSQRERELYFDYHNIAKKDGYQLHHIYPISYATSRKDLELIDNHKNLIYISNKIHSKIPRNNTFVKIERYRDKLFLVDPVNRKKIDITNDCLLKKNKISELLEYNKYLSEKIQ